MQSSVLTRWLSISCPHHTCVVTTVRYMVKTELVVVQYGERGNHLCLCHVESELTVGPWVNGSGWVTWVSICDPSSIN